MDGEAEEHWLSCRGPGLDSQCPHSGSHLKLQFHRESDALFWFLLALDTRGAYTFKQNFHIHKKFKCF